MLKEDADKKYLTHKIVGYREQGEMEMADRFMDAYIGRVGSTRQEIETLIKEAQKQAKKKKQPVKDEGDD